MIFNKIQLFLKKNKKNYHFLLTVIKKCVPLQSQNTTVSSSSLVRTSGFHPGNRGSNPLETTKQITSHL